MSQCGLKQTGMMAKQYFDRSRSASITGSLKRAFADYVNARSKKEADEKKLTLYSIRRNYKGVLGTWLCGLRLRRYTKLLTNRLTKCSWSCAGGKKWKDLLQVRDEQVDPLPGNPDPDFRSLKSAQERGGLVKDNEGTISPLPPSG